MGPAEGAIPLTIMVVYGPSAGVADEVELRLPEGTTLRQALAASGLAQRWPQADFEVAPVGVWGSLRDRDSVLRDRDRVEVYRPLIVDAMQARRERQRKQGKMPIR